MIAITLSWGVFNNDGRGRLSSWHHALGRQLPPTAMEATCKRNLDL